MVEVISCLNRDGTEVQNDLRWGVYVTFAARDDYAARCFAEYGLITDDTGLYTAMYKPWHLIGLELGMSVASAALRGEPTGAPNGWHGDVVQWSQRTGIGTSRQDASAVEVHRRAARRQVTLRWLLANRQGPGRRLHRTASADKRWPSAVR